MRLAAVIFLAFSVFLLAGSTCSRTEIKQAPDKIGTRTAGNFGPAYFADLKAAVRRHAQLEYRRKCGTIILPDSAFFPIEIGGGLAPGLAVSFAQVGCGPEQGSMFTGSGGALIQFWSGETGRPILLLEQAMHGFAPQGDRLVTMQHGGYCPGGAGPDACFVVYQRDRRSEQLVAVEKRLLSTMRDVPDLPYDYNCLAGTAPCRASIAASKRLLEK